MTRRVMGGLQVSEVVEYKIILKYPGCNQEIRTDKTQDLNKHMNLNGNLRKGQCQPALLIMQNPVPVKNPAENPTPVQNATPAENPISMQNQAP
ncbi:20153_t:CDS:2, partial [Dentiscutata erythropus]